MSIYLFIYFVNSCVISIIMYSRPISQKSNQSDQDASTSILWQYIWHILWNLPSMCFIEPKCNCNFNMQLWSLFSNKSTLSSNLKNFYYFFEFSSHVFQHGNVSNVCFLTHGETQFHNHLISFTFPPIIAHHSSIMIYCSIYTEDDCIHIPSTSYSISSQIYTSGKPLNMNSSTATPNSTIVLKHLR